MNIRLDNTCVEMESGFRLEDIDWKIETGQHWMIVGGNGAGKSALAATLCGHGEVCSGSIEGLPARISLVSLEAQAELISQELKKDDADILDVISVGTLASEILARDCSNYVVKNELIELFDFASLMDRSFRQLSSGETRKLMLIRALASEPELLILDEPFAGLDSATSSLLNQHLNNLASSLPMILVLNRLDQCPDFISDIAYINGGKLRLTICRSNKPACDDLYQLLQLQTTEIELPRTDFANTASELDPAQPLARLKNITISDSNVEILSGLDWTIEANQHWHLRGANGSGKTSLLSLITGDHPQCYSNDIVVFGFQRGNGESIWQIKQFIGYVSSAIHWEHRVSTNSRAVILSGFYDSIGLYEKASQEQQYIANQWLSLLNMTEYAFQPFKELSFGNQRLLLIARAMVKQPPLLILDEPCIGLDEINRQLVLALIEKICANSKTSVIYVSHSSEDTIEGINNYVDL